MWKILTSILPGQRIGRRASAKAKRTLRVAGDEVLAVQGDDPRVVLAVFIGYAEDDEIYVWS